MNQYTASDSLTDTIQFDAIATATNMPVKIGAVVSRPAFDFIQMPSGLGFKQDLEIVSGDTIDYVVAQTIKKKNIKLTLAWKGANAYQQYQSFGSWIATYFDITTYHIRFSYATGGLRRFVEVAAVDLELSGRDGRYVSATLTLQPLTPFYEEYDGSFTLVTDTNIGKIYSYTYPYVYGGGAYSDNNVIENVFIKSLPLKIVLKGPMSAPYVSISKINEDNTVVDEPYLRVQFLSGFTIAAGETVTIDAFNSKVYKTDANSVITDVFNYVDKTYDSFLYAKPGRGRISASLETTTSECRVSFVRYVL